MIKKKLGAEPAFPQPGTEFFGGGYQDPVFGMSKRFYAACMMTKVLVGSPNFGSVPEGITDKKIVTRSYKLADEILRQEGL